MTASSPTESSGSRRTSGREAIPPAGEDLSHPACPELAIVVPCLDEQEVLPITSQALADKVGQLVSEGRIAATSHVILVDDGSSDATWQVICDLNADPRRPHLFWGVKLAHSRGQQNALLAGLTCAYETGSDVCVSMDADLQDDPDAIDEMLRRYQEGCEVVYGVRSNRDADSRFKRGSARAFYRLMGKLDAEIVPDAADFRLMSRRALAALMRYDEVNLFLRGIVPMLGFKTATVSYRRGRRAAGRSRYSLRKMIDFAGDGITSFSDRPLRWVTRFAAFSLLVALAFIVYAIVSYAMGTTVSGWTSMLVSIWLVGGMIMASLGIVGSYVGKIYLEAKGRPRYEIERRID